MLPSCGVVRLQAAAPRARPGEPHGRAGIGLLRRPACGSEPVPWAARPGQAKSPLYVRLSAPRTRDTTVPCGPATSGGRAAAGAHRGRAPLLLLLLHGRILARVNPPNRFLRGRTGLDDVAPAVRPAGSPAVLAAPARIRTRADSIAMYRCQSGMVSIMSGHACRAGAPRRAAIGRGRARDPAWAGRPPPPAPCARPPVDQHF